MSSSRELKETFDNDEQEPGLLESAQGEPDPVESDEDKAPSKLPAHSSVEAEKGEHNKDLSKDEVKLNSIESNPLHLKM